MFSDEAKLVLGAEPSGLFEKVIRAPWIGIPRAPLFTVVLAGLELGVSELLGCEVVSVFVTFGIFIFGILNCAVAVAVKNEADAIAAISTTDNFRIIVSPVRLRTCFGPKEAVGDKFYTIDPRLLYKNFVSC
jgi:hypothetical protein